MSSTELTYLKESGYHVVKPQRLFGRNSELHTGEVTSEGGYREVTSEEMFGTYSELGTGGSYTTFNESLTDTMLFQSMVLITLVAYLAIIVRSWGFMRSIWSDVFKTDSDRRMAFEGGELPLQRFKLSAALLGLMVVALSIIRIVEMVTPGPLTTYHISETMYTWAPLIAVAALLGIVAWNFALHKLVGSVINSDSLAVMAHIGYTNFVRMVVVLYPIAAIWLLTAVGTGMGWGITLSISVCVLLLLYIKDTFVFFIGKKISIFYWILYLCTAILLPTSFIIKLIAEQVNI